MSDDKLTDKLREAIAAEATKAEAAREAQEAQARALAARQAAEQTRLEREAAQRRARAQEAAGGALPAAGRVLSEGAVLFAASTLATLVVGLVLRK